MRTALVGAVESSAAALAAMVDCGHAPDLVVALPATRGARHSDYVDLAELAIGHRLQVHTTTNVNAPDTLDRLRDAEPEIVFVIGWSQICGPEFLALPSTGSVGFHPSALPENRGRAVIPWTILQGLAQTGSSLFWLADGMDDGDLLTQEVVEIDATETARTLYDKHCAALRTMLTDLLPRLAAGEVPRRAQDHGRATYCARRIPADGLIDWRRPAHEVWTLIRASGTPYPGAFSYYDDRAVTVWAADLIGPAPHWAGPGQIVSIVEAGLLVQCGDGDHVLLRDLQFAGDETLAVGSQFGLHGRFGSDKPATRETR